MKVILPFLFLLMLMVRLGVARQQGNEACGFAVQGELTQPTVKGPDEIVPLVYVVEQPDSPIEVESVDLQGMWLSVSNEQHTEHYCAKYRILNRSDRTIQKFGIMLRLSTSGGGSGGMGTPSSSSLPPGQAVEIESCGVRGTGSAKDNFVRLLVFVDSVDFGDCFYKPSLRIPRSLKLNPSW
jgi:hypothetical protein